MFQGYSDETFEFFMALRFNNNTDFFHANHDWYLRGVREPSLALAEALSDAIEALDENLERRPNRVVSRINRDIRFSRDKSPYRDHIWLSFRREQEDGSNHREFFFDISANGAQCGIGFFRPEKTLLNGLRMDLIHDPNKMLTLWQPLSQDYQPYTRSYVRMYVPDCVPEVLHPFYTARGLYFEKTVTDFDLLKSPALTDMLKEQIMRLADMYRYLDTLHPVPDEALPSKS